MIPRRKRLDPARCRAILAIGLVAFFLAQTVAGFVIDWGPADVRTEIRFAALHERIARLRLEPRTPDLVCFGSSRFASAIDASELTHELRRQTGVDDFRAFNMAVPCGDPIAIERVLVEMHRSGIHPPAIVLETAPFSLLAVDGWYPTHVARQLDLVDLPEHGLEMVRSGDMGRFLLCRTMPLYVHRYAAVKKLFRPAPPLEGEPVNPPDRMNDEEMTRLLESTAPPSDEFVRTDEFGVHMMEHAFRRYEVGGASVRALERILESCARDGTRVVLVGSPLSSGYRKMLTPEIDARYVGCLDNVAGRFGASFVDCRAVLPDNLMGDVHHVRAPEGKIAFTRYLAREVLGPWLQNRSPTPVRLVHHVKP
jgi:hypothetical protein